VRGGVENTVKLEKSRVFIQFVFAFASLRDLDNCGEILGLDAIGLNIVPNVHF
jgi:hypothetical protein